MMTTTAALETQNLRLATKVELTDAYSFDLDGRKLLVTELAPYFGPERAPCAALDAIELVLPTKKSRRIRF